MMELLDFEFTPPKETKKKKSKGITVLSPKKVKEPEVSVPKQDDPYASMFNISTEQDDNVAIEISFSPTGKPVSGNILSPTKTEKVTKKKREKKSDEESTRELADHETNTPTVEKFSDTIQMLMGAIDQIEVGLGDLHMDSQLLRKSNDRKRFEYISQIQSTMGSYINTKVAAIREINNIRAKALDHDYKKYKDSLAVAAAANDDGAVINDYKAFVNMPRGIEEYTPLGATSRDATLYMGAGTPIGSAGGYDQYIQNMTPAQHMMQLESDPNIKEVVFYDVRTGSKWFDVVDIRTNQHVPNTETYDPMLLEEFDIDLNKGIARSINMGITLPLIVLKDETLQYY